MDPFIGEIKAFAFTYAPMDWATCDGQIVPIQQNTALFSVIGTCYGGDGHTNFALPNLRGRAPMSSGNGPGLTPRSIGQTPGDATVQLAANNFPPHTHSVNVTTANPAEKASAANSFLAQPVATGKPIVTTNVYQPAPSAGTQLAADAVQQAGTASTVLHDNMQPYLPVLLCIALNGIYPVRP